MSRANPATTHDNAGIAAWRFKMRAQIASYADCVRAMELLGNAEGFANIGPHMTLIHEGHDADPDQASRTYAIELYSTKIVRYYPDESFSAWSSDWPTPTTRARIQAVIPSTFVAYHKAKKLGVRTMVASHDVRWHHPLDHDTRISVSTGDVVSA